MSLTGEDREAVVHTINRLAQSGHVDEAAVLSTQFDISDDELNSALRNSS